ncbi:MAG: MFS transporter [Lachnospiraceae bacterium]|nr:MFS transporter [Lachnospiraceae bacterium]
MISLLLAIIYVSFISLGLPDSLLGSAWPVIYSELQVPISWSGIIFMIISICTVISSLQSDRLTKRFGAGKITAVSVVMTAFALLGFSMSHSFWMLCVFAIPYGLGAGSVDAALNNYVALHFESRHMSWLHCMWGVGASAGPYIMSMAISRTGSWNNGYRIIGVLQVVLSFIILCSLPLWKKKENGDSLATEETAANPIPLKEVIRFPGAKEVMLAFFCYCALEQTVGLWASSYLVVYKGISEITATAFASLFFIGITAGRAVNGFLTYKLSDTKLIHLGQGIIAAGIVMLILPLPQWAGLLGFILIGVGCAPVYPCIIHSTLVHFGREKSQAMVGVQMASAYIGTSIMPPLFGLLSNYIGIAMLPVYLFLILAIQFIMYNRVLNVTKLENV